jgi:hypothetical protein
VNALSQVMMWATRVMSNKGAKPHQILDIKIDANLDEAQTAFHKIARIAHPDLHRTTLNAEDLETVTSAYARAAAAYQEFRSQRMSTTRQKPIGRSDFAPQKSTPSTGLPTATPPAGSTQNAAGQMSSKALIYYRKAELSLRRGDLKGAILQMKMAIAADPQSAFLRSALAEVEAEVAKST